MLQAADIVGKLVEIVKLVKEKAAWLTCLGSCLDALRFSAYTL